MLRDLGIFGLDRIEPAIVAGLVTGDPVLLVGAHGTAKTTLCRRVAAALGLSFWAYDASKSLFEDILGFPNPRSLSEGTVDYVATPLSIWDQQFLLVDELSRAAPAMQNKWLEVIRSRQIMGKKLDRLEIVFAAMNPPTYLGAHPLDEALAGRFAVVVRVPEVREMPEPDVVAIVRNATEEDAPALGRAAANARKSRLAKLVQSARKRVLTSTEKEQAALTSYVVAVARFLESREVHLDGRRLGMIFRTLLAYLAVVSELEKSKVAIGDAGNHLLAALEAGLPFAATGHDLAPSVLRAAHDAGFAAATGAPRVRSVRLPRDPIQAVHAFLASHKEVDKEERCAAVTQLIARTRNNDAPEKRAAAMVALKLLGGKVTTDGGLALAPDEQFRILEAYRKITEVSADQNTNAHGMLGSVMIQEPLRSFEAASAITGFRMAFASITAQNRYADATEVAQLVDVIQGTIDQGSA